MAVLGPVSVSEVSGSSPLPETDGIKFHSLLLFRLESLYSSKLCLTFEICNFASR
jgi:hypothetical protein